MSKRLTIEFIKLEFEKEKYILLSNEYKNNSQKLDYICPNGHKHYISWNNWKDREARCPYCYGNVKLTMGFVKKEFKKRDCNLLTTVYNNCMEKLDYVCPKGHKHNISFDSFRSGHGCLYCAGQESPTIKFIDKEFKKEGYKLLSGRYKNNRQKLDYICLKGHKHKVSWHKWQRGQRCPFCSNNISRWEKEVKKFITNLNIHYVPNDKKQLINPNTNRFLELDIWFPQLSKAIECNGVYWHQRKGTENNDEIKQHLCKEHNIDLLVVTDKEWHNDQEECENKIKSFCS